MRSAQPDGWRWSSAPRFPSRVTSPHNGEADYALFDRQPGVDLVPGLPQQCRSACLCRFGWDLERFGDSSSGRGGEGVSWWSLGRAPMPSAACRSAIGGKNHPSTLLSRIIAAAADRHHRACIRARR
jgi:hypothetical protein